MRVRNVASGEDECNTLYLVKPLLNTRNRLPHRHDFTREIRRQIVETGEMRAWDDLNMAPADRVNIQEGEQAIVFKNLGRSNPPLRDITKEAGGIGVRSHDDPARYSTVTLFARLRG